MVMIKPHLFTYQHRFFMSSDWALGPINIYKYAFIGVLLGMAIFTRSAGTRSGPTLMGRILPDPIRNRVGFGFLKKKPKPGPGRVRVFIKPRPEPDPYLILLKKKKIPRYKYYSFSSKNHFPNPNFSTLSRPSLSLTLSHPSLSITCCRRSLLHLTGLVGPCLPHRTAHSSLTTSPQRSLAPPSPRRSLLHLAADAAHSSTSPQMPLLPPTNLK